MARPFEKPVPGRWFVWVKRVSWVELVVFASGITGSTVYVDKGYHAMGMSVVDATSSEARRS